MANIIYNSFLESMITNGIDLTLKNIYKICLLKSTFSDIIDSTDNLENYSNYGTISLAGFECMDTGKYTGYIQGGEYVLLTKEIDSTENIAKYYLKDRVTWKNVTLVGENAPKYILLYREGDGACIACFDLEISTEFNDDDLIIDWGNSPMLNVDTSDISELNKYIDSDYSLTSDNTLKNKVITSGFLKYGVAIGTEKSSLPKAEGLEIDTINNIDNEEINTWFDEV